MAEYINAEPLKKEIADFKRTVKCDNSDYLTGYICALSVVEGMIAELPAADVEPVVRCKDCKYYTNNINDPNLRDGFCNRIKQNYFDMRKLDDFCSYGERKDNENAATSEGNTLPEHYKQSLYNAFTGGKG